MPYGLKLIFTYGNRGDCRGARHAEYLNDFHGSNICYLRGPIVTERSGAPSTAEPVTARSISRAPRRSPPCSGLDLDPVPGPPPTIWGISALGHDAFEAEILRGLEQPFAVVDMVRVSNALRTRERLIEQRLLSSSGYVRKSLPLRSSRSKACQCVCLVCDTNKTNKRAFLCGMQRYVASS
jgi:hypothetical protein